MLELNEQLYLAKLHENRTYSNKDMKVQEIQNGRLGGSHFRRYCNVVDNFILIVFHYSFI